GGLRRPLIHLARESTRPENRHLQALDSAGESEVTLGNWCAGGTESPGQQIAAGGHHRRNQDRRRLRGGSSGDGSLLGVNPDRGFTLAFLSFPCRSPEPGTSIIKS